MNKFLEKYASDSIWLNWKLEERKGRQTKVPYYYVDGHAKMASSTNSETWGRYYDVLAQNKNVGFVFRPDKLLCGIDLDKILVDGTISHPKAHELAILIATANSYTEVSQSGNGLHIILALSAPLDLVANRHENFEVYTEGRYFVFSARPFGDEKPVRTVTPEEMVEILKIIQYPWKKTESLPPTSAGRGSGGERLGDTPVDAPPAKELQKPLPDIVSKMFAASNGPEIEALWNGDTTKYAGDNSRADAALLAHLAFYTQKDPRAMESLWLRSPLGAREKTKDRKDYRVRSIASAIDHCSEVYTPPSTRSIPAKHPGTSEMTIDDPALGLLYATKGKHKVYYKNMENITRIISKHPHFAGTFRFDEYRDLIERKEDGVWRKITDIDQLDVQTKISVLFSEFANVTKDMVYDAIAKTAHDHRIDSARDYINSIIYDGTPRLDSWLSKAYHTPDDEYHKAIGSNWLKGMVKRILHPGAKFDYVLVLEGAQGIRKSTSLDILAGKLGHIETTTSTETKDFFMQFQGNAIVEFSEGETLNRTEVKRMKAIITMQVDKFRAPYGRVVTDHPRRCVFAMTTNQTEYLKDETGNRRWLPVAVVGNVDTDWIEANREQLFAEAAFRLSKGETTWDFPEAEMKSQQAQRRILDPNTDVLTNWYVGLTPSRRREGVTVVDAYREALNGGFNGPMTRQVEIGIADVFRTSIFLEKKTGMVGGMRITRWYSALDVPDVIVVPESVVESPFNLSI